MDCYLGIDFGTSGARAIVIDAQDHIQVEVSETFSAVAPDHQAQQWEETLWQLISALPKEVRSQIQSIAINGTSSTLLLGDAEGNPCYPPQMYNDTGDAESLEVLAQLVPAGHPVLSASSSLAKLLTISSQVDMRPVRYLMHQADWLAFLFHGRLGWSDEHNSLKLGYDPAIATYPSWFQQSPLRQLVPLLPRIVKPGTPLGPIQPSVAQRWGIPGHCQICAGTTDSIAAFIASGADQPGMAVTSLGSTLVLKLLSPTRVDVAKYGIYSHRLGDYWLVGGASNTGGAVLQSFFSPVELRDLSHQINPDQPSPLTYYPLLKPGERFPVNDPHLQPQLSPRPENPVDFLHGLLDSIARIEATGYRLLQGEGAPALKRVYTAGGGAQNEVWQAMRQRHLQVPCSAAHHQQAAYGTALLAARGLSQ